VLELGYGLGRLMSLEPRVFLFVTRGPPGFNWLFFIVMRECCKNRAICWEFLVELPTSYALLRRETGLINPQESPEFAAFGRCARATASLSHREMPNQLSSPSSQIAVCIDDEWCSNSIH
jgi:hypothetical protein